MSWRVLAAKDVRDGVRSKTIWLLSVLLVVLFGAVAFYQRTLGVPTFVALVGRLSAIVTQIVPLLGLLVGYKSIASERINGNVFLTLSVPHSRKDLAIGTFVGRTIIVVVPLLAALLVAGVIGVFELGADGALRFPWFLAVTALFTATFVAIGVGISMVSTDDRRLTLVALSAYVLLVNLYGSLHSLTLLFLHRGQTGVLTALPDWALLYRLFQPSEAYFRLLRVGFESNRADLYLAPGAPFYVDWWMGLVVFAAFCVGSLGLGYRRFRTGDL